MMNEEELRSLVREAVGRHLGRLGAAAPMDGPATRPAPTAHASHARLPVHSGSALGGRCLIEPVVMCSHCGYCQSYGH